MILIEPWKQKRETMDVFDDTAVVCGFLFLNRVAGTLRDRQGKSSCDWILSSHTRQQLVCGPGGSVEPATRELWLCRQIIAILAFPSYKTLFQKSEASEKMGWGTGRTKFGCVWPVGWAIRLSLLRLRRGSRLPHETHTDLTSRPPWILHFSPLNKTAKPFAQFSVWLIDENQTGFVHSIHWFHLCFSQNHR